MIAKPKPAPGPAPRPRRQLRAIGVVVPITLALGTALWSCGRSPPAANETQQVSQPAPAAPITIESGPPTPVAPLKANEVTPLDRFPGWANSSNAPLILQLLDPSLPLQSRRSAAHTLAKTGSDEAFASLKTALRDEHPYLKAGIAEALGECPQPEAGDVLMNLLNATDETVARGAVRGFALQDNSKAADVLSETLFDTQKPESVRTEAALALGDVHQPTALATLIRAAEEIQDETVAANVLEGLSKRPFAETADFFQRYLESPDVTGESKVAALEALGNATGETAPLLLKYAANPDPALRAAAAWGLTLAETPGEIGPQLAALLRQETSPDVRSRLYQALGNLDTYDVPTILALARDESDPDARLAGLTLLAACCRSASTPELLGFFNQTALPELKNQALTDGRPKLRLEAVMALGRAGTSESESALAEIARRSGDPMITQAAQAALRPRGKR